MSIKLYHISLYSLIVSTVKAFTFAIYPKVTSSIIASNQFCCPRVTHGVIPDNSALLKHLVLKPHILLIPLTLKHE